MHLNESVKSPGEPPMSLEECSIDAPETSHVSSKVASMSLEEISISPKEDMIGSEKSSTLTEEEGSEWAGDDTASLEEEEEGEEEEEEEDISPGESFEPSRQLTSSEFDAAREGAKILVASACFVLRRDEEEEKAAWMVDVGCSLWDHFKVWVRRAKNDSAWRARWGEEDGLLGQTAMPVRIQGDGPSFDAGQECLVVARRFMARASARLHLLEEVEMARQLDDAGVDLFGWNAFFDEVRMAGRKIKELADAEMPQSGA